MSLFSRILTTLIVIWMLVIITGVTWVTFMLTPDVPVSTAGALATVYLLATAAIGLWQWKGDILKDERSQRNEQGIRKDSH